MGHMYNDFVHTTREEGEDRESTADVTRRWVMAVCSNFVLIFLRHAVTSGY